MRSISLLVLVLSVAACAANTSQRKVYSYPEFTGVNADGTSCTTGTHGFSTLKAECVALQDEAVNQNCALQQRQTEYANKCPGMKFKSTNSQKTSSNSGSGVNSPDDPDLQNEL